MENGRTVPAIETLQKLAGGLELPPYRVFCEGDRPPEQFKLPEQTKIEEAAEHDPLATKLLRLLARTKGADWRLLL